LISKTYLNRYRGTIYSISFNVNYYLSKLEDFDEEDLIRPSFYLRFLSKKQYFYKQIILYKNNKKRFLFEPSIKLKYIQKYILYYILYKFQYKYNLDECVTGFVSKKGILENAKPHLNRVAIVKMDIKDFFPSITRKMIYNIFRKYNKFSYEYAYILSHLVTYEDALPQGAPTSPFLANICAKGIDYKINKLIEVINKRQKMNIAYTRYADDITISFDKKFNYDYIVNVVTQIIFDEGFYPNLQKTNIIKHHHCQMVTGIVVNNDVPTIEKKQREKIKFILNIWEKYGIEDAIALWNKHRFGRVIDMTTEDKGVGKFLEVVEGKITYFQMVNEEQNRKLFEKYKILYDGL
jgi:hypothetical protein